MPKQSQARTVKNRSTKAGIKWRLNQKSTIILIAVVIVGLLGLLLFWLPIANGSLYITNKEDARANIQSVLDQMQPSGKQVYSEIVDLGCDSGNSVGLATFIHCEMEGHRYFTNRGNLSANLHSLDTTLVRDGWKRMSNTQESLANNERILAGTEAGSVSYIRNEKYSPVAAIELLNNDSSVNTERLKTLIEQKKISPPAAGETIIGVHATKTYWSCRGDAITKYPCMFPPSKPE